MVRIHLGLQVNKITAMNASDTGNTGKIDRGRLPGSVFACQFNQFEAYEEAFQAVDLEFRQLDCGPLDASLKCVDTPSVQLSECRLGRKIEQKGQPESEIRTFGVPAAESFHMRSRGREVGPRDISRFSPGEEIDCITNPGFHVFAVAIPEWRLREAAERRGLSSIDEMLPKSDVVESPTGCLHIRRMARRLIDSPIAQPELLSNPFYLDSIEVDFVEAFIDELSMGRSPHTRPMAAVRNKALRSALDAICNSDGPPANVAELEKSCGASSRTLRYAFLEHFGSSPMQYLLAYRLNQVRRQLLHGLPGRGKISDAANEFGFWHLGDFASHYRRFFGELPSETLANSR